MNAFDGVLGTLSLLITYFIWTLDGSTVITQNDILVNGVSVSLAIGISGLIGAYLAESAEMRKADLDQRRAMMLPTDDDGDLDPLSDEEVVRLNEEDYYPKIPLEDSNQTLNGEEIEKIDVDPKPLQLKVALKHNYEDVKIEKSISERAETFAFVMLSLADGLSPVFGAIIGLIPFFIAPPDIITYLIAFIIEIAILFGLGSFLANVSEGSKIKYGMQMVLAGILTAIISTAIMSPGVVK
jgi:predicted membrane protein (TIGR00267 family)